MEEDKERSYTSLEVIQKVFQNSKVKQILSVLFFFFFKKKSFLKTEIINDEFMQIFVDPSFLNSKPYHVKFLLTKLFGTNF